MKKRKINDLETCARCHIDYPVTLLSEFFNGRAYEHVCGICALARANEIHGTARQTFSPGSQAEEMRLDALAWREDHPVAAARGSEPGE